MKEETSKEEWVLLVSIPWDSANTSSTSTTNVIEGFASAALCQHAEAKIRAALAACLGAGSRSSTYGRVVYLRRK